MHGEGEFPPEVYSYLPEDRRDRLRKIKTVIVWEGFELRFDSYAAVPGVVDTWLFDSGAGSGQTFDWQSARTAVRRAAGAICCCRRTESGECWRRDSNFQALGRGRCKRRGARAGTERSRKTESICCGGAEGGTDMRSSALRKEKEVPGRFGLYGGRYVPETLMAALEAIGARV